MEEFFIEKKSLKNNNKLFDINKDLHIIRINLKAIYNESKDKNNRKNKKDINNSITESDSDIEEQNINLIKNNKNVSNKNLKKHKLSKSEKILLIKGIYKYKNNLKKIKKYMINKPISDLRINAQKFFKRIKRLVKDSKDENIIKSKVELLLKRELKKNYEPSNLPNFILFLIENVLSINKKKKKKKMNKKEKINKNEINNELTTATTKKSNEILTKINNNTIIKSDYSNSLMNKTLFLNENDNFLNSINIKNENNFININNSNNNNNNSNNNNNNNSNNKDNNDNNDNNENYNLVSYSFNINNPLKKEKLFNDELTIQNDIFNFGDSIHQSLFYPENDILYNQILKMNDSNILIDEYFK